MKIAILSGKGGTGKTTLSVNLFSCLTNATLIDTDTEEPNAHLFIESYNLTQQDVFKNHPVIELDVCNFCGLCGSHCNFNAIIPTKKNVLVFEDLCHDCGLCAMVCPTGAISYKEKAIGTLYSSRDNNRQFHYGKLHVGEVSGVRLIEALHELSKEDELIITDCPPGVSCSTVAALKDSDYAIICAEPTPFGLSDMKMVVELLNEQEIPFGVVVNKSGIGDDEIYRYLEETSIELLETIPWTRQRANLYSTGSLIWPHDTIFKQKMEMIIKKTIGDQL